MPPALTQSRTTARLSLRVPSVRGSSALGPDERAPDFLVVGELRVRLPHDRVDVGSGLEHKHRVHALLAADPAIRPAAASRTPAMCVSTRSTSSGKTLSPSGVTIISFLRPRMYSCPSSADFADVAGVEPSLRERTFGFLRRVEVAASSRCRRGRGSRRPAQSSLPLRRWPCRPSLSLSRTGDSG